MGEKDTTIRNALILTVLGAGAAWGGVTVCKNLEEEGNAANRSALPSQDLEPTPGNFPPTQFAPSTPQSPQEFGDQSTTSCAIINNPGSIGYDKNLPIVPNAFRAVMNAGVPGVIEKGPYTHVPGVVGKGIRQDLGMYTDTKQLENLAGFNPNVNPVHSGDAICVEVKYDGRGSHPGGVVYQAIKSENNLFAANSINIRSNVRSKRNL